MTDTGHNLLAVESARVTYAGDVAAVKDASFTISPGEHVAIVGESGSGKTTLALAIAGLLTAGDAECSFSRFSFDGCPVSRGRVSPIPHRTPGMSMVFQNAMTSLDPVATVGAQFRDVLRGLSKLSRKEARRRSLTWLASVGLRNPERVLKLRPYELSGGMRQRVMLALAMCGEPKLLIADEPTSALDASVSRDVMDLIRSVTERSHTSLLMVTHDIDLCRMYVDKVIVMYKGEIVDICAADRIEDEATHPYTRALTECVPTLASADLDRLPTLDHSALVPVHDREGSLLEGAVPA
ncbi:ABC transporter ATP-binding protein [Gordonia sp. CPCC 206044]|uniref:ABC transporter ATP-binding protein n=1 Tax=Gordonia sp. CPCC 206044 TaxID=3140793 RepID=UPI003AF379A0